VRYAIFSDIHSNIRAFTAVLQVYKNKKIDKYYCLGDIVGYGVNPKQCIKLIKDNNIFSIAGNHDWAVSGRLSMEYFQDYARVAVIWTQKNISEEEKKFLDSLDILRREESFVLAHGTLYRPEEFHYMFDLYAVKKTFALMKCNLCFVGHTHCAEVFMEYNGKISYSVEPIIGIETDKKYIVNVGSVGQPRDSDPRASFCIYDTVKKEIEFCRVDYDWKTTSQEIINAGLPAFLANRLIEGK